MTKSTLIIGLILITAFIGCETKTNSEQQTNNGPINISLVVDFEGDQELIEIKNLELPAGSSIREAIQAASGKNLLSFKDTLYSGMGHLLLSINNAEPKGSEFWFYCVNGKKANKGIDGFKLNNGDQVKWALTEKSNPCN